jgi:hypothetical protein
MQFCATVRAVCVFFDFSILYPDTRFPLLYVGLGKLGLPEDVLPKHRFLLSLDSGHVSRFVSRLSCPAPIVSKISVSVFESTLLIMKQK